MKLKTLAKVFLMIGLSIVLFQATLTLSFAQGSAGLSVREETTTLENIYQDRVRGVLNNLIAPEDYTLVISATIKNDEKRIREYNELMERKFMPGLPVNDPSAYAETNNILLGLKQKIDIQVILTESVPQDRDTIVRDILKNKLHLSEETGDTITVVRAARLVPFPKQEEGRQLPELSAKMIAFWILVAMMALTGVLLWLQRRKEKAQQAERAEQALFLEQKRLHDEAIAEEREEKAESEEPPPPTPPAGMTEEEKSELSVKIALEKSEILKLCTEYGPIVAKAIEEFMIQGHVKDVVIVMEILGWGEAKRLFKDLDARSWAKIGNALRERIDEPTITEIFRAAHYFHRFALSYVLERTAKEDGNPFSFVFKLGNNHRLDLLKREDPEKVALIGVYCSGPQFTDLLRGLEGNKQNEILYHLTRIKQLPETQIKSGVLSYLASLERIKKDPSVFANGPVLAADFLRSLPAGREEELVQYLYQNHPGEAEKLRRVRVMFQDIPFYPQEMTQKVIDSLESEVLLKALSGQETAFTEKFLAVLPSKKAMMIQNDLVHARTAPPHSQCAEARRAICSLVEQEFESQRFSITSYWRDADRESGFSDQITEDFENERTIHDFSGTNDDDGNGQAA